MILLATTVIQYIRRNVHPLRLENVVCRMINHLWECCIFEICVEHGQIFDMSHAGCISRDALITDLCICVRIRNPYDDIPKDCVYESNTYLPPRQYIPYMASSQDMHPTTHLYLPRYPRRKTRYCKRTDQYWSRMH